MSQPSSILVISIFFVLTAYYVVCSAQEGFESIYTSGPEWFQKRPYDINDWFVEYHPDQISKPECMKYRGDPEILNYNSSAYRFWRF